MLFLFLVDASSRHCEEQSDEAIQFFFAGSGLLRPDGLAMTAEG